MKCLRCGKKITSLSVLKCGIGGGCKSSGNSKSKIRWQNKVRRTIDYQNEKPISLDSGKSHWEKMSENDIWVNDKSKQIIRSSHFDELLKKTHSILGENDVDQELLNEIKDDLDEFFNKGVDKNDDV